MSTKMPDPVSVAAEAMHPEGWGPVYGSACHCREHARKALDAIGYDALVVERDHWKRERDRYRDGLVEIAGRDHWDTRHGEAQTIAYRALDDGVRVPLAEGDEASHQ